jgi:hypothetical protein
MDHAKVLSKMKESLLTEALKISKLRKEMKSLSSRYMRYQDLEEQLKIKSEVVKFLKKELKNPNSKIEDGLDLEIEIRKIHRRYW